LQPVLGEPITFRSKINATVWTTELVCVWGIKINATTGLGEHLFTRRHDRLCVPAAFTFSAGGVPAAPGAPRELWFPVTARRCPGVCSAVGLSAVRTPSGHSACWLGNGYSALLIGEAVGGGGGGWMEC
jgi:hypothetical protein